MGMVVEAEERAGEDKIVRERIDSKNAFVNYIYSMRSTIERSGQDAGLGHKMDGDEKKLILNALDDGQSWLDSHPEADAEEIKEKQREVEGICAPIVGRHYGTTGTGGGAAAEEE